MVDSSMSWTIGKSKPRNKAGTVILEPDCKAPLIQHTEVSRKQYILWTMGSLWRFSWPQLQGAQFGISERNLQWWWYTEQLGREWSQSDQSMQVAGPEKREKGKDKVKVHFSSKTARTYIMDDLPRWNLFQKKTTKALIVLASQVTILHSRNTVLLN